MPHTVLGTGDIEVNKTDTNPCLHGAVHTYHLGVGKVQPLAQSAWAGA